MTSRSRSDTGIASMVAVVLRAPYGSGSEEGCARGSPRDRRNLATREGQLMKWRHRPHRIVRGSQSHPFPKSGAAQLNHMTVASRNLPAGRRGRRRRPAVRRAGVPPVPHVRGVGQGIRHSRMSIPIAIRRALECTDRFRDFSGLGEGLPPVDLLVYTPAEWHRMRCTRPRYCAWPWPSAWRCARDERRRRRTLTRPVVSGFPRRCCSRGRCASGSSGASFPDAPDRSSVGAPSEARRVVPVDAGGSEHRGPALTGDGLELGAYGQPER